MSSPCASHTGLVSAQSVRFVVQFTQKKTDGEIRWAVLNVTSLLRRHSKTHEKLAGAMAQGASVAACIGVIEDELKNSADL